MTDEWESVPIDYINTELRELYLGPNPLIPRPAQVKTLSSPRAQNVQQQILDVLGASDTWLTAYQLGCRVDAQPESIRRSLYTLMANGEIQRQPHGKGYLYKRRLGS